MSVTLAQVDTPRLISLSQQAQSAYQNGQTAKAIRIYLDAYRTVDADPSLLYNVAFIYERMGEVKNARTYYRKVGQARRASAELRLKAYQRMDALPEAAPSVPLLADQPAPPSAARRPSPRAAPPKAPVTSLPAKPTRAAARTATPKRAPITAPPSAAAKTKDTKRGNRRLSPEQQRREEMRRRRAARKAGKQ